MVQFSYMKKYNLKQIEKWYKNREGERDEKRHA